MQRPVKTLWFEATQIITLFLSTRQKEVHVPWGSSVPLILHFWGTI